MNREFDEDMIKMGYLWEDRSYYGCGRKKKEPEPMPPRVKPKAEPKQEGPKQFKFEDFMNAVPDID